VSPPLVAHVVDYFEAGGLENGLANLINEMPRETYRHAVLCVKGYTMFRERVRERDVPFVDLGKKPGTDPAWYGRLWRELRRLRPAIVHTRNLGTLDAQPVAAAACAAVRIHGEHGRDVWDIDGTRRKYTLLRKVIDPCIHQYVAVSSDLEGWLARVVHATPARVARIHNGVDTHRFRPAPSRAHGPFVIGTVGRMAEVKDHSTLVKAFLHMIEREPDLRSRVRLTIAGDGPLRERCLALARAAGAEELCWMPGRRNDIPDVLRSLDLFVLPSLAEGTSNTILEAMATGLPVVATAVGGNPELVVDGATGTLVPAADSLALAAAMRRYVGDRCLGARHGDAGRRRAETEFSLAAMVAAYTALYDRLLSARRSG
jgi:sugar transferase (PEP-CTERM/EpsH1 system associated)